MTETQRRALVEDHLDLVPRLARAAAGTAFGGDVEYAVTDGYVALADCVARYDPTKGKFRAFASRRVYGAVIDSIRLQRRARGWIRYENGAPMQRFAFVPLKSDRHRDVGAGPFELTVEAERRNLIARAPLTVSERQIIERRLFDGDTQQTIADALGISFGRVSQLERQAVRKLRAYLAH